MSIVTGFAQLMIGAGWWPATDDADAAENVVVAVDRTEPDEVGVAIRPLGSDSQTAGTLYLTPEMARALGRMLTEAADGGSCTQDSA